MINIFSGDGGEIEIWSDCEEGSEKDGRCIGSGKTFSIALHDARNEILADLEQLERLAKGQPAVPMPEIKPITTKLSEVE